jgi:hypothetical protein
MQYSPVATGPKLNIRNDKNNEIFTTPKPAGKQKSILEQNVKKSLLSKFD